jgi:hypothetical protein
MRGCDPPGLLAMTDSADGAAFQRSRQHRRGVRRASIDLEEVLARPVGHEPRNWYGDVAVQVRALAEAFRHHVEQSEGSEGLLPQIVEAEPRLVPAVEVVKREHKALLAAMSRLEAATGLSPGADEQAVRKDSLRLLHDMAVHRQRGADLIYEAYYVDVEGGG